MVLHSSGEDYLKAILILQKNNGKVRSVDVAAYMGVSAPYRFGSRNGGKTL